MALEMAQKRRPSSLKSGSTGGINYCFTIETPFLPYGSENYKILYYQQAVAVLLYASHDKVIIIGRTSHVHSTVYLNNEHLILSIEEQLSLNYRNLVFFGVCECVMGCVCVL